MILTFFLFVRAKNLIESLDVNTCLLIDNSALNFSLNGFNVPDVPDISYLRLNFLH